MIDQLPVELWYHPVGSLPIDGAIVTKTTDLVERMLHNRPAS